MHALGPRGILSLLLRLGGKTTLNALEDAPHGLDLGALEPRLPEMLGTPKKKIRLAPKELLADVPRLAARLGAPRAASTASSSSSVAATSGATTPGCTTASAS